MRVTFVSLFPEYFVGPMTTSVVGRAVASGALAWDAVSPRDFAVDRHRTVDDTPFGGGAGMVMRAPELAAATRWARSRMSGARVALMSPQGARFEQRHAELLAREEGLVIVCGRYEGVDERFVEACVDIEISLGDFVLTGGEPAAVCVVDAVARLLPGVLGNAASSVEESFSCGGLEHPQFTRPSAWEGVEVPAVLRGGDHGAVARWRARASALRTLERRPDLATDEHRELAARAVPTVDSWLVAPRQIEVPVDGASRSCILRRPDTLDSPESSAPLEKS